MLLIKKYLELVFRNLKERDWDNVIAIVGDEGVSKSTLNLHITEAWYTLLNGVCNAEDIKHVALDRKQFLEDLKDCKKCELTVYDEAGDLGSRRSMSNFNVSVMQAYQVIRGDNLFTILTLPSLWDLDSFFTKRRLRGLFVVYKRGRVAFWNRKRLRQMVTLNEARYMKNYWVVRPNFLDTYPKYVGILREPYNKKKAEKMKGIREELFKQAAEPARPDLYALRDKLIVKLKEQLGTTETAKLCGLNPRTVRTIVSSGRQGAIVSAVDEQDT